jgi:hypothetical protein
METKEYLTPTVAAIESQTGSVIGASAKGRLNPMERITTMANTQITKTNGKVLPDLTAALARIAELEAKLNASRNKTLTLKIGEKGALSVYGLQRFPVTLYRQQWERLFAFVPDMQEYIKAHADSLTTKD